VQFKWKFSESDGGKRSRAVDARVAVMRAGALYAAKVAHCHTTGKYDVV
jgi:hypothetical protein